MRPKYVDNGTHGCVFRPSVSCTDAESNDQSTVSKVFKNVGPMNEEVSLHNEIVQSIDPDGRFTVKLIQSCDVTMKKFPKAEVDKCINFTDIHKKQTRLPQIVYEYGGIDLREAARRYPFEELFAALVRVFVGLTILSNKGYVHFDIKPQNMVYDNESGKLALIDFGLSTEASRLYRLENDYLLAHPYAYYPPEFPVISNWLAWVDKCPLDQNQRLLLEFIDYEVVAYPIKYKECPDFLEELHKLHYLLNTRLVWDGHYHPMKVDVYMLGASIIELLYMCERHGNTDINKNPEFYTAVLRLCRNMIEVIPRLRLSPKEALADYKLVHKKIRSEKPSSISMSKKPSEPKKTCPPGRTTKTCDVVVEKDTTPKKYVCSVLRKSVCMATENCDWMVGEGCLKAVMVDTTPSLFTVKQLKKILHELHPTKTLGNDVHEHLNLFICNFINKRFTNMKLKNGKHNTPETQFKRLFLKKFSSIGKHFGSEGKKAMEGGSLVFSPESIHTTLTHHKIDTVYALYIMGGIEYVIRDLLEMAGNDIGKTVKLKHVLDTITGDTEFAAMYKYSM